jgi:hypothetical protein
MFQILKRGPLLEMNAITEDHVRLKAKRGSEHYHATNWRIARS